VEDVNIGINNALTVTFDKNATCASLLIDGSSANTYLKIQSFTLNVTGNVTGGINKSILTFTSGLLNIGGNLSNLESITAGTGIVNYNGVNQNIGAYTYRNLILSGSGTKTMQSATTVTGNVTIGAEATLNEAGITMTLGENSILTVNGTLDFSDSDGIIRTGSGFKATLQMGSNGLIKTVDQSGIGPTTNA